MTALDALNMIAGMQTQLDNAMEAYDEIGEDLTDIIGDLQYALRKARDRIKAITDFEKTFGINA